MIDQVLERPHRVEHQRDLVFRYYGMVDGEEIRVVIAFDMDPPFIVSVMAERDTNGE